VIGSIETVLEVAEFGLEKPMNYSELHCQFMWRSAALDDPLEVLRIDYYAVSQFGSEVVWCHVRPFTSLLSLLRPPPSGFDPIAFSVL
jgi:hypothetical protein